MTENNEHPLAASSSPSNVYSLYIQLIFVCAMLQSRRIPRIFPSSKAPSSFVPRRMSSSGAALFDSYLISPAQLSNALKASPQRTVPISAAWFLPNDPQSRTGHSSFVKSHIPSSRFFDLDLIADTASPYPHMLPSAAVFSSHMRRLNIRKSDTIVVYDTAELGLFSAPRVAWTFRVFGHAGGVHVLNNYKSWVEQSLPTTTGEQESFAESDYEADALDETMVMDFDAVKAIARENLTGGKEGQHSESLVIDARSRGRWAGNDPEPRKGLSSGHIPGSVSVPFTDVIDPQTKLMKTPEELRDYFKSIGADGTRPIVASCGTGVTASVLEAALKQAGIADGQRRVYDGSWTEWAQRASKDEGLIVHSS